MDPELRTALIERVMAVQATDDEQLPREVIERAVDQMIEGDRFLAWYQTVYENVVVMWDKNIPTDNSE